MTFYLGLVLLNIVGFLPLYLLNFREQKNPLEFLIANRKSPRAVLNKLYWKKPYTDPIRINFDYSVVILGFAMLGIESAGAAAIASAIWIFGLLEVTYASVMRIIFKRTAAVYSDISLAKTGLNILQRSRWLFFGLLALVVGGLAWCVYLASGFLLQNAPATAIPLAALAVTISLPALYHWRSMAYPWFLYRTVYSPILSLFRNFEYSESFNVLRKLDSGHFEALNDFVAVDLQERPNFITVCVESYGSYAFSNPEIRRIFVDELDSYSEKLADAGYYCASNLSEPPLFAGGSWLSYTSFTYGIDINNLQIHDALFYNNSGFSVYESLFHVLKRNGYRTALLCPLGGFEDSVVNWDQINRCFQSDRNFDFESLGFEGKTYPFMSLRNAYFAPDQYSLNVAFEAMRRDSSDPFSLFFCTMNSHFPYVSPTESEADWRVLNDRDFKPPSTADSGSDMTGKYAMAIRYQLRYLFDFALENKSEDFVLTLFGDHQPPFITPDSAGKKTPIHVICKDKRVTEELCRHGFVQGLNPLQANASPISHAGFLSLFMRSINGAFGRHRELDILVREAGADLFDQINPAE